MGNKNLVRLRPTAEDYLRGAGYLTIMVWSCLFMFLPPHAFVTALDLWTRALWMAITFVGSSVALAGCLSRIDIKMELPGLLFTQIGPLFYFASQVYYVAYPLPSYVSIDHVTLIAYAILPGILLLPRTYGLYAEGLRMKRINYNNRELKKALTDAKSFLSDEGDSK